MDTEWLSRGRVLVAKKVVQKPWGGVEESEREDDIWCLETLWGSQNSSGFRQARHASVTFTDGIEVATPGRQYINLPQRYLRKGESPCSPTVELALLRGVFLDTLRWQPVE